jgi:hypothetical protein
MNMNISVLKFLRTSILSVIIFFLTRRKSYWHEVISVAGRVTVWSVNYGIHNSSVISYYRAVS